MSADWVTAIATVFTSLIIATSAVAALIQLRHMRTANQLEVLKSVRDKLDSRDYHDALQYIMTDHRAKYADPAARERMLSPLAPPEFEPVRHMINFFDAIGSDVRSRMVDGNLICERYAEVILRLWDALAPYIYNKRAVSGLPAMGEDFEYLVALANRWKTAHAAGTARPSVERMPPAELWPETERAMESAPSAP